ncbi:MAG TPA: SDR family oxidoreductase [Gemmatimonadales bacterium]|nr:SDR family oxidoreductase [Gemmatimonadales bacterium]
MHETERVFVVGGTRGTGLLIAHLLLRSGYPVRVLARDPSAAARRLGSAVDVVPGDVTKSDTLGSAVKDVSHLIFTAGVAVGPAREKLIVATEYQGVLNTLAAARQAGFNGRFLYMTSIGVTRPSLSAAVLNLVKGNTLRWRKRVEDEIRTSGVNYTIIRAGFLLNSPGGKRAIEVSQQAHPLAPRYRIARADVAETFVQALNHANTARTTFEVVWGKGSHGEQWELLFSRLKPDSPPPPLRRG